MLKRVTPDPRRVMIIEASREIGWFLPGFRHMSRDRQMSIVRIVRLPHYSVE